MLGVLIPTMKSGLEVAFLLAVLAAWMEGTGRRRLLSPLKWGGLLGTMVGMGLAYGVESFLEREVVEGVINLSGAVLTLGLILWLLSVWNTSGERLEQSPRSRIHGSGLLVFTASLVLVAIRGLDIALRYVRLVGQGTGLLSTELAAILGAVLLGLTMAVVTGLTMRKVVSQVSRKWMASIAILALLILLVQEATTAVQIGLVRGVLPLTDWLFRLIVPLVNHYAAFYYALFVATSLLVLMAAWEHRRRRDSVAGLNPAQARKLRAASRRMGALTAIVGGLLTLAILVDGANTVYADRPLKLSPATPVASAGGLVNIREDSVMDGKLHHFSFQTSDGTVVRFLVLHKGSGVFGVGLDACTFCGVAGYRQDGESVICSRCGAALNIATIGFPGGCNPIPVQHRTEGGSVVIPAAVLEAAAGVFAR